MAAQPGQGKFAGAHVLIGAELFASHSIRLQVDLEGIAGHVTNNTRRLPPSHFPGRCICDDAPFNLISSCALVFAVWGRLTDRRHRQKVCALLPQKKASFAST